MGLVAGAVQLGDVDVERLEEVVSEGGREGGRDKWRIRESWKEEGGF